MESEAGMQQNGRDNRGSVGNEYLNGNRTCVENARKKKLFLTECWCGNALYKSSCEVGKVKKE